MSGKALSQAECCRGKSNRGLVSALFVSALFGNFRKERKKNNSLGLEM